MAEPLEIKNTRIAGSTFNSVDMAGTTFDDVNLSGCTFRNVNLGNCDYHDTSFGNSIITGSCFVGCEIPHGNLGDLRIAGVRVEDLLAAYVQVHGELPEMPHADRAAWPHH